MQANPVSGSANADVLHRFVAAFNAKDEDALGKILTPDVVDHHLPPGLPAGIDGLKTWLGIVWAAFDAKLNLDDVVAAGDRVASRWTFAGTHIGEFNGLPASGREFSVHGMSIEHIADGRIAERWATADLLSLLQQINRRKGSGSRARPEVCLDGQWRDAIPRAAGRRKRRRAALFASGQRHAAV